MVFPHYKDEGGRIPGTVFVVFQAWLQRMQITTHSSYIHRTPGIPVFETVWSLCWPAEEEKKKKETENFGGLNGIFYAYR